MDEPRDVTAGSTSIGDGGKPEARGYPAGDVARLLDLSIERVRFFARAGFLEARRNPRGEYRFGFRDLVLLRTAKELLDSGIPARRVRTALRGIRERISDGTPLSSLKILAVGDEVLAHDRGSTWEAESGQVRLDFEMSDLAGQVASRGAEAFETAPDEDEDLDAEDLEAEDWYELAQDIASEAPDEAREAYRRALELDPRHVDARVGLGRLLHEGGRLRIAETQYRLAIEARPEAPELRFRLGLVLEEQGRTREATVAYREATKRDPGMADAYFRLAQLHERAGDRRTASRYLNTYHALIVDHEPEERG